MYQFISGAMVMACLVIGLYFLRFWRETTDRFFLIFAIAFWLLGAQRTLLAFTTISNENRIWLYLLRLLAFLLILGAIIDKNVERKPKQ